MKTLILRNAWSNTIESEQIKLNEYIQGKEKGCISYRRCSGYLEVLHARSVTLSVEAVRAEVVERRRVQKRSLKTRGH